MKVHYAVLLSDGCMSNETLCGIWGSNTYARPTNSGTATCLRCVRTLSRRPGLIEADKIRQARATGCAGHLGGGAR